MGRKTFRIDCCLCNHFAEVQVEEPYQKDQDVMKECRKLLGYAIKKHWLEKHEGLNGHY